jgi:hypothetical protein
VTGPDLRITAAAEFLNHARKHRPGELSASQLVREDAELRRQLGQVLDVVGDAPQNVVRFPGPASPPRGSMAYDAALALDALAVAAEYRRYRASLPCQACERAPDGVCDDHVTDAERASEYDDLADRIREQTS